MNWWERGGHLFISAGKTFQLTQICNTSEQQSTSMWHQFQPGEWSFSAFRNHFSNIDFAGYQESGQWSVRNSEVYISKTASTLHTFLVFPAVEYHVQLCRKPFYHTMYMIMPSFVLSLIALLMFWLPPESGEKVSLGITVFLAFSVLMFSLSDDLPESSDTFPIIGKGIHIRWECLLSSENWTT